MHVILFNQQSLNQPLKNMPDFAAPLFLLLLVPLVIGFIFRWFSRPAAIAVSSVTHFTGSSKTSSKWFASRHFPLLGEFLAGALIIFCLARPQQGIEITPETEDGTDIMLVLDLSKSMELLDPERGMSRGDAKAALERGELKDRLEVSQEKLIDFIKRRPNDRIGLAVFSNLAYTVSPPTLDHDYLTSQIRTITHATLAPTATNIAAGLTAGINTLLNDTDSRQTIILVTDGSNSVEYHITPLEAASIARKKNITIHAIAVGDTKAIARRGYNAKLNSFDTSILKKIAAKAEGSFFRVKDSQGFEEVLEAINTLEKRTYTKPALIFQKDLYPPYLLMAAILLLSSTLIRYIIIPEIY